MSATPPDTSSIVDYLAVAPVAADAPSNASTVWAVLENFVAPIVVAIVAYVLVDRLGEWKRRRMQSRLGAAVMHALQDEVKVGVRVMRDAKTAIDQDEIPGGTSIPTASWDGMATISDEVLMRILECSKGGTAPKDALDVRDIRIHCKNYFAHMSSNFGNALHAARSPRHGVVSLDPLRQCLGAPGNHIRSGEKVADMLGRAERMLDKNASRMLPR